LAAGAGARRRAGEAGAPARGAARPARLAGPAVDGEIILEPAAQPRPADVVADGRAAVLDGPGEYRLDRVAEPVGLGERQRLALAPRVQLCQEARLVGVDVADPGDDGLVEQDGLEGARRPADGPAEVVRVEPERLRPESGFREERLDRGLVVEVRDAAEPPL